MGSVPLRISRISENLRVIQSEISFLAGQELESSYKEEPLGEPDVHALRKVKSSVDHLRQVLRTYIDFASAQIGEPDEPDAEEFQRLRSERTTQILRYACQGLQRREGKDHEVPASLFEQLTQMAIATVDRYRGVEEADKSDFVEAVAD